MVGTSPPGDCHGPLSHRKMEVVRCQVDDYSKVVIESFDPIHKARLRTEALPQECERAFELERRLAGAESVAA
ncbi:hypothetical protein [Pelobacter propionicus]|uniref:Uncharacterized protein n=1 Tax=Pelobacter propionicus (strain DSM 2379 / NBRC 103807 / OttBd1) TaxID=338966 RepID=A1ALI0_PELPD|nr:hypothetical protein [Pelobacter propionicus]ABK98200.1 hypothetical protein Ppro_0569 [Pelobacter propionicus DSM 2379]